jgi:predicted ABC-type ATPase
MTTIPNKNLFIIAGCNGTGKTTASFNILPEMLDCSEFGTPTK